MWVAWRRLRSVVVASILVVTTLIVVAVITGRTGQHLATEYFHAPCNGGGWSTAHNTYCSAVAAQFSGQMNFQNNFVLALVALVLVLASSIGAITIAGEFDRGTVRWAWTQSRSRRRWWAVSTLVALVVTVVLTVPLAITMAWWVGATRDGTRFGSMTFLIDGWILVPFALAAVVITLTGGLFLRRPGWLVALGVVVAFSGYYYVQRDLPTDLVPVRTAVIIDKVVHGQFEQTGYQGDQSYTIFSGYRALGDTGVPTATLETPLNNSMASCQSAFAAKIVKGNNPQQNETPKQVVAIQEGCQTRLGLDLVSLYIPESEFWTLQDREGALFLTTDALLWWGGWWWVRRARA